MLSAPTRFGAFRLTDERFTFREAFTDAVVMQSQPLPDVEFEGVLNCRSSKVVARVARAALGRGSDGMSDRIQPDVAEIPIYGRR